MLLQLLLFLVPCAAAAADPQPNCASDADCPDDQHCYAPSTPNAACISGVYGAAAPGPSNFFALAELCMPAGEEEVTIRFDALTAPEQTLLVFDETHESWPRFAASQGSCEERVAMAKVAKPLGGQAGHATSDVLLVELGRPHQLFFVVADCNAPVSYAEGTYSVDSKATVPCGTVSVHGANAAAAATTMPRALTDIGPLVLPTLCASCDESMLVVLLVLGGIIIVTLAVAIAVTYRKGVTCSCACCASCGGRGRSGSGYASLTETNANFTVKDKDGNVGLEL